MQQSKQVAVTIVVHSTVLLYTISTYPIRPALQSTAHHAATFSAHIQLITFPPDTTPQFSHKFTRTPPVPLSCTPEP